MMEVTKAQGAPLSLDDARLARRLEKGIADYFRSEESRDHASYEMNATSLDSVRALDRVQPMVVRRLREAGYRVHERRWGGFTVWAR
jgi:hypothetical protein